MVEQAKSTGTGARALQSELEKALIPHMFNIMAYQERGITCVTIDAGQVNVPTVL